ncbi:unnamed protein product [Timema podura]|uniref:Cuticle protein n=1 Tax=Timema podura TaxID=61482 RepID=A0ABN7P134_TIMPD|nr:unnamed protein product [Timema podura]
MPQALMPLPPQCPTPPPCPPSTTLRTSWDSTATGTPAVPLPSRRLGPLDGVTRGGYSYIDAHGLVQSASYVSDPINGFRVAATNLPVGPSAPAPAPVHAVPAVAVHSAGLAAPVITPSLVDPVAIAAGAPLPVGDTPEVIAAKINHYNAHVEAKANLLGRKKRSPGYLHGGAAALAAPALVAGPARSFGYSTVSAHASPLAVAGPVISSYAAHGPAVVAAAPLATPTISAYAAPGISAYATHGPARSFAYNTVAAAPLAAPAVAAYAAGPVAVAHAAPVAIAHAAPVAAVGSSQYQAQDELGQYSYGYADGNSVKHESRAVDGTTHGAYSYVDGNGIVQSVKYHADALGFRAHGTNFPVA